MNTSNTYSQFLTLPQAAQLLAIKPRTLYRLIARKQFPRPLKIGRSSRVTSGDVADYQSKLVSARGGQSTP